MKQQSTPRNFVTRTGRKISQTSPWKASAYGIFALLVYGVALIVIARLILGDK